MSQLNVGDVVSTTKNYDHAVGNGTGSEIREGIILAIDVMPWDDLFSCVAVVKFNNGGRKSLNTYWLQKIDKKIGVRAKSKTASKKK